MLRAYARAPEGNPKTKRNPAENQKTFFSREIQKLYTLK